MHTVNTLAGSRAVSAVSFPNAANETVRPVNGTVGMTENCSEIIETGMPGARPLAPSSAAVYRTCSCAALTLPNAIRLESTFGCGKYEPNGFEVATAQLVPV